MNKIATIMIMLAVLFVLTSASSVFAAEVVSTSVEIDMAPNASAPLVVGLSPKVVAIYYTDGTSTQTSQWYAIGAVHPGGTEMFGTAQNLTNTYTKDYTAGTSINAALFGLPASKNSASDWSDNGWEL